ncbi:endoglucanase [Hyunsoonleella jejuensis]|uniref:Endoglucanase n=2 Tax=Hyunsoonleella jejuensis TaxID=419940 RepID=A0A1H9DNQ9_9FLAO|nr:endoglucanase [Hyunsoonleella jejuensis]
MVSNMGRGINIGNVLSAPVEGNWAPAVTQQYFTDVASAGFTNVRVPIDFFGDRTSGDTSIYSSAAGTSASYTGSPSDYVVSATYLDRVEEVITWGLNEGLIVILDFHGAKLKEEFLDRFDQAYAPTLYTYPDSARRTADNEKFRAIWGQIANRLKDYSYNLLFEIVNEPYFRLSEVEMNTINTDVLSIIRASGSNNTSRNVIITGGGENSWEAPLQIDTAILSGDAYLIPTFHYYLPFKFTSSSRDPQDQNTWGDTSDKSSVETHFDNVLAWANTNNVPVFLGEFGADNTLGYNYSTGDLASVSSNATGFADGGPDNASRVEYHRFIAEEAISRGFSFAAWDAGPESNKTIHKRTDAPSTVNYDINDFTVISYDPKNTSLSTVIDSSTWVEDVKNALLGITGTCETSGIISNADIECGFDTDWSLLAQNGAVAAISNTDVANSYNSSTSLEIDVTTAGPALNAVVVKNLDVDASTYASNNYVFSGYAKASSGSQSMRIRLRVEDIVGAVSYPGKTIALSTNYQEWTYEYTVPANTAGLEFQIICGASTGSYYFDAFKMEEQTLSVANVNLNDDLKVYPNPASNVMHIASKNRIQNVELFDVTGKNVYAFKDDNIIEIQTVNMKKGFYLLKLTDQNKNCTTRKILLN